MALEIRDYYQQFDIINQSYGAPGAYIDESDRLDEVTREVLRNDMPQTWSAVVQADRPADERTIHVRAAGNCGEVNIDAGCPVAVTKPEAEAYWPYWIPELRGHTLAVAATDPETREKAGYSAPCGALPADWDAEEHGRHYCLTAPGTVRGLVPLARSPGQGEPDETQGTSFAAPVVSGALALMMEHFRGTRGNTAIVRRMLDTADNTGPYDKPEIYGAGHLDLEKALSPVGSVSAGQEARPLSHTRLSLPTAFGLVSERLQTLELATFDEQEFPFWVPMSEMVGTGTERTVAPFPTSSHVLEWKPLV